MSTETIVLYPAPGSGHMVPMVELGKLFVRHYSHKFSVTILYPTGCFLDSPSIASYIHQTNQSHPSISFRPLPPPAAKTDYPSETRSGAAVLFNFIRQNDANVRLALKEIMSSLVIRAFVIDVFCTSALAIAQELNVPTFYFHISGAAALALFLYIPTIHAKVSQSFKDMKDTVFQIPGVEAPLRAVHMPDAILDRNDPAYSDFVYFCSHLPKSSGIIVNTFEENEADEAFQAISQGLCVPDAPTPPVHYFGPLIAQELKKSSEDECLLWLDKQPSRSVVYVCSGSRGSYSVTQLREIANGLERSGQRFLWVVKKPPTGDGKIHSGDDFDLTSLLPEGFLRRTEGRGMVVKSWAPQVAVLNKEAVGGFVTHCGWNSVLESVVAGVAMVAWPMEAEQYFNRNFLVKDMKMAIDVKQREEDGFVSGEEVERAIRELMESKQGRMLRDRSLKLKEIAVGALGDNGSSKRALINFVNGIN